MPSTYDVGDIVRVIGTFTDTGGTVGDPSSVHFHYDTPTSTAPTTASRSTTTTGATNGISKESTGVYFSDITTTGKGLYEARIFSTGTLQAAGETWFSVRGLRVTTG